MRIKPLPTSNAYPWQRPSRTGNRSSAPGGYGTITPAGYRTVRYPTPKQTKYEHRLVWEYHNGPIPPRYHVHHINGDKTDNRIENLSLVSEKDHMRFEHSRCVRLPDGSVVKQCRECNRSFPLDGFHPLRGRDGRPRPRPTCRECYNKKQRLGRKSPRPPSPVGNECPL